MIAIANDHIGYELKHEIIKLLEAKKLEYIDFGTFDTNRCDYPVYASKAAKAIVEGDCDRGILFCGTGVGISIAANKMKGIRCVACSEPYSAIMSKRHNDTNMIAIGSRVVGLEIAKMIIEGWLEAEYEGGRFQRRIEQLKEIEMNQIIK